MGLKEEAYAGVKYFNEKIEEASKFNNLDELQHDLQMTNEKLKTMSR